MILAAAQIPSTSGDYDRSISTHLAFIDAAIQQKVDLLFFPELSLTGYEPAQAHDLALSAVDERLRVFQQRADSHGMTIMVGAPWRHEDAIKIGLFTFRPNEEKAIYAKRMLHEDELSVFSSGDAQLVCDLDGHTIVPAICYESVQPEHLDQAMALGANIYLSSVAKSTSGIVRCTAYFEKAAKEKGIPIMLCNAVGAASEFVNGGGSSIWNKKGERRMALSPIETGLLLYNLSTDEASFVAIS